MISLICELKYKLILMTNSDSNRCENFSIGIYLDILI